MDWKAKEVSFKDKTQLIEAIRSHGGEDGIILIKDLDVNCESLMKDMPHLFDRLAKKPHLIKQLNEAYKPNLVFKDSKLSKVSNNTHKIDNKRTLDLGPHRIAAINRYNDQLLPSVGCMKWLSFFDKLSAIAADSICKALDVGDITADSVNFNFRMLDYYPQSSKDTPGCQEHRDFGLFTLIFQDRTGGLQIESDGKWIDVPAGTAVLLFGFCAQILSNNRLKAANHRVIQRGKRRNSAVLFVAPHPDHTLVPFVKDNEKCHYSDIKVATLKERMRNAWKVREGTLSEKEINSLKHHIMSQSDILETIKL